MQPFEVFQFRSQIAMLFPKGAIAIKERNLLFIVQGIMLLVIIPVYILTFIFSWKYRAHNAKAKYDPDLVDNRIAEYIWWGVPLVFTIIICVLAGVKTYELDPFKPLVSDKKPMKIQVVALQWKWLFIYPEEKIATVNFVQFPEQTPIDFEITADAPMNSFWIPDLGGQIYAMPKMKTKLHLIADKTGEFRGASANLSGEGFAGMHFIAKASSDEEYQQWLQSARGAAKTLHLSEYETLALPSKNNAPEVYQLQEERLFDQIMDRYTKRDSRIGISALTQPKSQFLNHVWYICIHNHKDEYVRQTDSECFYP
ncbi:MAG: COX aromatic rich motif-containing protein [Chlamydiia bacterium]|nr:COX aromatic rich motif-containing protein [Chlamydiia bacterium]